VIPAAALFHPSFGETPLERALAGARSAAMIDQLGALRRAGVESVYIVTPPSEAERLPGRLATEAAVVRAGGDRFHFGETLARLIRERGIRGLVYFGSGSGVLLDDHRIARLVEFAARSNPAALFNNYYSCDFAAIAAAGAIAALALPEIDNALGFALSDAGVPCYALPRCAETQFDVDTPVDLSLLSASSRGGPALQRFLEASPVPHPTLPALLPLLADRSAHVGLLGRVNPAAWAAFESEVACRTSGWSEGRGMRAAPLRGTPLLQRTLREDGPDAFLRRLAGSVDGALVDTRVLLDDGGPPPSSGVRFACDLFRLNEVGDPRWRAFGAAAAAVPIPIVLGGHSLVSGGLYLLAGACWKGRDLPRRLHPESFPWEKESS